MADRGHITIQGRTFRFASIRLPDGLPTRPSLVTDEIAAPGVDGVLVVNNKYEWQIFSCGVIISYATLAAAQQAAEDLMGLRGRFASAFETDVMGRRIAFRNLHLAQVRAVASRCLGGGPYAVSGHAAQVDAIMTLRPTSGVQR